MTKRKADAVRAWGMERVGKRPYLVVTRLQSDEIASLSRRPSWSPEFKSVRVRIIRESDYRKLLKDTRHAK